MQGAPTPRPRERVHTMSLDGVRGVELVPSATATRVAWCSELRECAAIVCEQVPPRAVTSTCGGGRHGAADDGAPPTDLRHLMQQLPGGVVASAYCGVERALAAANERLREEWAPYETLWRDDDEASAAAGAEEGDGAEEQEEDDSGGRCAPSSAPRRVDLRTRGAADARDRRRGDDAVAPWAAHA